VSYGEIVLELVPRHSDEVATAGWAHQNPEKIPSFSNRSAAGLIAD
jgi:hypothetical protein